jgi:hypothetical protein
MKQVPLGVACEDFPGPTVSSPDEVIRDAHALGEGESPGPARRPQCSSMSEKKATGRSVNQVLLPERPVVSQVPGNL